MQASICSRCGKNPAVVFITKIEGSQTKSEGLCLKCARELHIKPVDDILTKMGISDEDLENLSGEMMNALNGVEELMGVDADDSGDSDEDGKLVWECPCCGNRDQDTMNVARRTCGYIGTQFWNQGRTQEIQERVLHL